MRVLTFLQIIFVETTYYVILFMIGKSDSICLGFIKILPLSEWKAEQKVALFAFLLPTNN